MNDVAVQVHSKTDCPHCDEVKSFLKAQDIPFTEVTHDDDADRQALYDKLRLVGPARTVPQVVVVSDGEEFRIGSARGTIGSGVQSLFHPVEVARHTKAPGPWDAPGVRWGYIAADGSFAPVAKATLLLGDETRVPPFDITLPGDRVRHIIAEDSLNG